MPRHSIRSRLFYNNSSICLFDVVGTCSLLLLSRTHAHWAHVPLMLRNIGPCVSAMRLACMTDSAACGCFLCRIWKVCWPALLTRRDLLLASPLVPSAIAGEPILEDKLYSLSIISLFVTPWWE